MTVRKVADIIIRSSPNGRADVTGNGTTFYSYDKNSAAIDFHIQNQDGSPTDLINVDIKLLLLTKENGEWKEFTMLDGVETMSEMKGLARYIIPDELRGYVGIVEGYVYLNFNDGSRSDECHFNFKIERSRIEEKFEHAGEYYIKEIQDTLDETIAELKKYAAEKIKEYEAQLSSLNSKILNTTTLVDSLETQTTSIQAKQAEILKLIADNNVATKQDIEVAKQETSANVVDQVIGNETSTRNITTDMKNKVATSVIENPNLAFTSYGATELLTPENGFETPQSSYDELSAVDTRIFTLTRSEANKPSQLLISWDILTIAKKNLGEKFFFDNGAMDKASQIELLRKRLLTLSGNCIGFGSGPGGYKLNLSSWRRTDGTWQYRTPHTNATDTKISNTIGTASILAYIDEDGFYHNIIYAESCDGVTPSTIKVNYVSVEFTLSISANNHIESMIATNHVQNLATQEEAEAGTDNKKSMTPLRVFQAIAKWTKGKFVALSGDETIAGAKNFTSTPLVNSVAVAKTDNVLNLTEPQAAQGVKNFKNGIQLNGLNVASEYAKAVDTDKYNQKGAVYLGGNVWIAWETLTFQNTSGYSKDSYIRLGSDNNAAFTYPDVKNTTGGYIWLGGACQPDYTDGGFGSYHITIENNFDDARKPIVRFVDSPTTPVKKLAVRGVALIFAPAPTENSKI